LKVSANVKIAMQRFENFGGGQMPQMPSPPGCAPGPMYTPLEVQKKLVCNFVLVPRALAMHSGRGDGAAAVQSSCSFVCCAGIRTERTRCVE